MKRSSFLKTLLGVAIAPKVLGEIKTKEQPSGLEHYVNTHGSVIKIDHKLRCGDVIKWENHEGFYRVVSIYSDGYGGELVRAMYQDSSKDAIAFQQGDKRFTALYSSYKEKL